MTRTPHPHDEAHERDVRTGYIFCTVALFAILAISVAATLYGYSLREVAL